MPQKNNYSLLAIVIFLCLKGLEQAAHQTTLSFDNAVFFMYKKPLSN